MKRVILWTVGAALLVGALVVGLSQAGGGDEPTADAKPGFDLAAAQRELAGAPRPLARLHAQSNRLLDGGRPAFRKRLRSLRGYPVVVSKWASWCGPCRAEFPILQKVATERGAEIAFLGLNSRDSDQPARDFLAEYPVPFPSYLDPREELARSIQAPKMFPIMIFIDRSGEVAYIHQGGYTSVEELRRSIDRYLAP